MAIASHELHDLPPLEDAMQTHRLLIGDVAMFASLSPEKRQQAPWAEMRPILEPYVAAGQLAVEQTTKTSLSVIK